MSNDLWFHALKVLDSLRTSSAKDESEFNFKESFYKFEDDTDILKKHREHLEKKYTEENVDVKTMYIGKLQFFQLWQFLKLFCHLIDKIFGLKMGHL